MTAKQTIIITGASGFIGRALVAHFADSFNVAALDLHEAKELPRSAAFFMIDFASDESVQNAVKGVRWEDLDNIASVIHLAAYFDLTGEPNPKYEEITVQGTARLLHALGALHVEQFILFSSMLAHKAGRPGDLINEDWPLEPSLPYRTSKVRAEQVVAEQSRGIPAVLLRPAGVYDDKCRNPFLARQIARIYEHNPKARMYPGDLRTGQSFLHLHDLVDAVARLVELRAKLPPELPLLIGEPEAIGYGQLQSEMGRLIHGEPLETWHIPKPLALAGTWVETEVLDEDPFIRPWMIEIADDHYELDITRARSLIGWEPKHSLRKTLPKIVEDLKADPIGWYEANKLNAAKVAIKPVEAGRKDKQMRGAWATMMHKHMDDMHSMHFSMLWVHYLNLALGLWLAVSPLAFGTFTETVFSDAVLRVTAERELWAPELRSTLTAWSDLVAGLLIALFALLSLSPRFSWAQWANTAIGVWLLFAPLIFWTPSAAVYANDTLVGALVITFAILVPMMPGMSHEGMMDQNDVPPGWTYSPSSYLQRLPIIVLGFVGLLIARQLASYQLGHTETVWEPFFSGAGGENGTEYIITSDVSKAWPIADAGLGAVSYIFEVLMGVMGDRRRWRTMPWMVLLFGIVVVPLGVVSVYFIIIQPIVIGTYCTLCLAAALAMIAMIPFALDELVAMGQFLVTNVRRGRSFWRSFFMGDELPGSSRDKAAGFDASLKDLIASAARGNTLSWTLILSALLGVWLMFSRMTLGTEGALANSDHLIGALVITVAVMALSEVGRPLRFINAAFGLWLLAAPWLLAGGGTLGTIGDLVVGLVLIALSLPRGTRSEQHYGGWDRYVF